MQDKKIQLSPNEEISLKDVILKLNEQWEYSLSQWLIIVVGILIGSCIGIAYSFYNKPMYKAELSFALEDDKSGGSINGALGLASQFGFDLGGSGGGAFSGDNLLELMKSRSMVEKTLLTRISVNGTEQTLAELYLNFNDFRQKWEDKPSLKNIHFFPDEERSKFTLKQDSVLGEFHKSIIKDNLVVEKADKKLSIIVVKVNSPNELFSKFFTETLVKQVGDFYVDTKIKKSTQNLAILQYQTDSVRRELNAAISGVAISTDAVPNLNPSQQILRVPSQRRSVDVQANQAILTELIKNLEISKVSLRRETPLIQVIDRPILPLEKEKFGKLKGIVFGGAIAGFLTLLYLLMRRILKEIMF